MDHSSSGLIPSAVNPFHPLGWTWHHMHHELLIPSLPSIWAKNLRSPLIKRWISTSHMVGCSAFNELKEMLKSCPTMNRPPLAITRRPAMISSSTVFLKFQYYPVNVKHLLLHNFVKLDIYLQSKAQSSEAFWIFHLHGHLQLLFPHWWCPPDPLHLQFLWSDSVRASPVAWTKNKPMFYPLILFFCCRRKVVVVKVSATLVLRLEEALSKEMM